MLLKDFYTIETIEHYNTNKYLVGIVLNKEHDIFKGHFPNNPVTPGVCMLQIIKEVSQNILKKNLFLKQANNVKFMALINPEAHSKLNLNIEIIENENNERVVKNITTFGETVALKLTSIYKEI